jgi:hypothetical protein
MTSIRAGNETWLARFSNLISLPLFAMEVSEGAKFSLYAATSPEAQSGGFYGPNGFCELYGDVKKLNPPNASRSLIVAKKFWEVSEELTHVNWNN